MLVTHREGRVVTRRGGARGVTLVRKCDGSTVWLPTQCLKPPG